VFVLGFVGSENSTAADENGSQSGSVNSSSADDSTASNKGTESCFGIISPIPAVGELNPYDAGLRVCYGFRMVERASCAY
jgi:hypothetical protein